LGTSNKIKTAIDSNGQYRRKRNQIAHKAKEFKSESFYKKYRQVIDDAIIQLIKKLSQKVNHKQCE
jgi:hypothetical protein